MGSYNCLEIFHKGDNFLMYKGRSLLTEDSAGVHLGGEFYNLERNNITLTAK